MARVGVEHVCVALLNETDAGVRTYSNGRYIGPVTSFTGSVDVNDVKDYGDNRIVETEKGISGGTLSVEVNELTLELRSFLLGHSISEGEMTYSSEDIAPMVGVGCIGKSVKEGTYVYKAKWYAKVQFGESEDTNETGTDSTSFNHDTISGTIMVPIDHKWKYEEEFATYADAEQWLHAKAAIA